MQCAQGSSSGQRQELNTSTPAEGIAAFCSHSILCLHRAAVPWPNMSLRAFSSVSPVDFSMPRGGSAPPALGAQG